MVFFVKRADKFGDVAMHFKFILYFHVVIASILFELSYIKKICFFAERVSCEIHTTACK